MREIIGLISPILYITCCRNNIVRRQCQGTIVPETRVSNYCNPGELLRSGTRVYGDVNELTRALTHPLGSAYRTGSCTILHTLCSLAPKVPMPELYNLVNRLFSA